MKRYLCILLALLLLTGCAANGKAVTEPTAKASERASSVPENTGAASEPEASENASVNTTASGNESSETEAPTTEPAATEAPTTEPAATEALTTEPAATEAPETEAPSETEYEPVIATGRVIRPMPRLFEADQPLPNGQYSVKLEPGCLREDGGVLYLTAELYDYERFDPEEVRTIRSGDVLLYLGQEILIAGYTEHDVSTAGLPYVELNDEVHAPVTYPDYPFLSFGPDVFSSVYMPEARFFTAVDGQSVAYCGQFTDVSVDLKPVGTVELPCAADANYIDYVDYVPVTHALSDLTDQMAAEPDPESRYSASRMLIRVENGTVTTLIRDILPGAPANEDTEPTETETEEPAGLTGRIVRPMAPLFSVEEGLPDGWYSVALSSEDFYEEDGTLRLRTEIYDLERFDPEQMLALKAGDQIETMGNLYTISELSIYSYGDEDLPTIELFDESGYPLTDYLSFSCNERLKMYTRTDTEPLSYYGIYSDDYTNLYPVGVADLPTAADAEFEDHQVYDWSAPTDEYGAPAFVPNRPAADLPALVASYETHRAAEDDYLYSNEQDALAFPEDSMTIRVENGVITAVLRRFVP